MLASLQNSTFRITQNVSPKLRVSKYLKTAITFFVVSVIMCLSVSASWFTQTQDGLVTRYSAKFDPNNFTVKSWKSNGDISRPYPNSKLPNISIRATYDNVSEYQNGPFSGATRLGTYQSALGFDNVIQFDAGIIQTTPQASVNGETVNYTYHEAPVVCFDMQTVSDGTSFDLSSDFVVTFEYYTYFDESVSSSADYYLLKLISNTALIGTVTPSSLQLELLPTYVQLEKVYTSDNDHNFYKVQVKYATEYSGLGEANESITISGFKTTMYSSVDIPMYPNSDYPVPFYTRYNMSFSDIVIETIPTDEALEALVIYNASNDDLIQKLGYVNEIDQGQINYRKAEYEKVSTATGQLSGMTDFSESLSSQVDLSQRVDVLTEGTLVDGVSNMWDIFPWESDFFTLAIAMIASISLLSLILHGGERAIFSSSGKGKSSRNNKGGDD